MHRPPSIRHRHLRLHRHLRHGAAAGLLAIGVLLPVAPFTATALATSTVVSASAVPAQRPVPGTTDGTAPDRTIACPLGEASEFTDSWGAARSGGRRHEGVDMIAPRGTPVIAVQDGAAQFKQNRLGGNAVWLTSHAGHRFYYAHLDRFEGASRDVVAGEVIGYVGSTGNAKGPHLHFETHFDDVVVNPYPATLVACTTPPAPRPEVERTWTVRPAGTTMTIELTRRDVQPDVQPDVADRRADRSGVPNRAGELVWSVR